MNERVVQFRVGVMVLSTMILTGLLVLLFGEVPKLGQGTYTVYLAFQEAPGVTPDTPIRKSGILIGRVRRVDFAEDLNIQRDGVIVTARIDGNRRIRRSEIAQIGKSLLGDAVVEIVPGQVARDNEFVGDGETLPGVVASDPLAAISKLEGNLTLALQSISRTSDEIGTLSRQVNDLLANNDEQFVRILSKAEQAIDQIRLTGANLDKIVGDPQLQANLRKSLDQMPIVLSDLNQAVTSIRTTVDSADRNLRNLEGLTKPLGDRGPQLVANVESATAQLEVVLEKLTVFGDNLSSPDGTLGRLINNPELYDQLNQVVTNINDLSTQLRPIVRDVRTFTDKVARHPEVLGVRGAIRPSPGIK